MNSSRAPEDTLEWYVWTVKVGKFELVKEYIEKKIPAVNKILYPTLTTERTSSSGEVKKKKSPLYSGYMFLQYTHDPNRPSTWFSLNSHPFVTGYVGPCSARDLVSVDSLQKIEVLNDDTVKKFKVGDKVRVNGGLFINYTGIVVSISSNSIATDISSSGKKIKVTFSPVDLDILNRFE